ncbi:MAG: hypothetical protein P4L71_17990 [Acetobacteraceae bacterium]|nr:hypothetical protein [Acetobacteraceae bacterium]
MSLWAGTLDRSGYVRRLGAGLALLLLATVWFPFIAAAVFRLTGCTMGSQGCNVLPTVTAAALKPLLFYGFVLFSLGISVRRARHAGLRGWFGAFIPLMFLADSAFILVSGAGWGYAFSLGIVTRLAAPRYAEFAVAVSILLAVPREGALRDGGNCYLKWTMLGLAGLLAVGAALRIGSGIGLMLASPMMARPLLRALASITGYAMVAFLALGAIVLATSRAAAGRTTAPTARPPAAKPRSVVFPALAATILALVAIGLALVQSEDRFSILDLTLGLTIAVGMFGVPTFLLYFAPIAAGNRAVRTRSIAWLAVFIVCLAPFGSWLWRCETVHEAREAEARDIANIPKVPLTFRPSIVLIEGEGDRYCVRAGLLGEANGMTPVLAGQAGVQLPDKYLDVHLGRVSQFAPRRAVLDATAPPFEIYSVEADDPELIAVSYTVFQRYPFFPPLTNGFNRLTGDLDWFRGGNTGEALGSCRSLVDRIRKAIAAATDGR